MLISDVSVINAESASAEPQPTPGAIDRNPNGRAPLIGIIVAGRGIQSTTVLRSRDPGQGSDEYRR
jgi:hypothetical protein